MLPVSATGTRSRRVAAALFASAFIALGAVGCGGGDSGEGSGGGEDGASQDALRAKLKGAADKLATVPSLEASTEVKVALEDDDSTEDAGACFALVVVRGKKTVKDDQVALRTYDGECSDGSPGSEVLIVGSDLWASQFGGQWTQARVDASLLGELGDEGIDYDELLDAATDLSTGEEPDSYEFTAPASAFSQTEGAGEAEVDFTLTLNEQGYLRALYATVEIEEAKATVEQSFEKFGEAGPVKPPPAGEVVGSVRKISSEAELESLLEPTFEEGFE